MDKTMYVGEKLLRKVFFPARIGISTLLLCVILSRKWKQNRPHECAISYVLFTRCLPIAFTPHRLVCSRYWTRIILWPNCYKFVVECVSSGNILYKRFLRSTEVFWQKLRKIWKLEKLENMIRKVLFRKKKRFNFPKSLLYRNGKAQKMPVVAGRLVFSMIEVVFLNRTVTCRVNIYVFHQGKKY